MSEIVTADAPLAEDVPCMRCGYDLRTKRPSENCPECGAPVAPSLDVHHRGRWSLRHPRRAAVGAWLMAAATLGTEVWVLTQLALAFDYIDYLWGTPLLYLPLQLLQAAIAIATLGGIVLLVNGATAISLTDPPRRSKRQRVLKVLFCVLVLMAALSVELQATTLWTFARRPMSYDALLTYAFAATGAALAVLLIGGWLLARLAWRQRWKAFAAITALLFALAAVNNIGAGVAVYLWWQLFPTMRGPLNKTYLLIRFTIDYGSVFLPLAMAFYWTVLALRLRKLKAA